MQNSWSLAVLSLGIGVKGNTSHVDGRRLQHDHLGIGLDMNIHWSYNPVSSRVYVQPREILACVQNRKVRSSSLRSQITTRRTQSKWFSTTPRINGSIVTSYEVLNKKLFTIIFLSLEVLALTCRCRRMKMFLPKPWTSLKVWATSSSTGSAGNFEKCRPLAPSQTYRVMVCILTRLTRTLKLDKDCPTVAFTTQ